MSAVVESGGVVLTNEQFERFRALVRRHAGIALRDEKKQLVCSRLSKRLRALELSSFDDYYAFVEREDPHGDELQKLLNAITTNKTNFFRESHHFELLRDELRKRSAAGALPKLRVWSAGSSTGEEAYSILMTITEALPSWDALDVRVLASDIDTNVLSVGERGVYDQRCLDDVPPELAERWLIHGTGDKAGLVRVRRELRQRAAFRQINFIADHWPLRATFDAIFCRNALIYFDQPTQVRIVDRLLTHLSPGGLLFLGHAESMAGSRADLVNLGRTSYRYAEH
jgi:chemotaxis protein methyltransferase CheR